MRSVKSNSISNQRHNSNNQDNNNKNNNNNISNNIHYRATSNGLSNMNNHNSNSNNHQNNSSSTSNGCQPITSPICRCRVTYLGSSVPHITKDGLQGIQEPLRELYPDKMAIDSANAGIDSWLSVWSNGILIENVDETGKEVKRFFKIDALHYCAAVKYVPLAIQSNMNPYSTMSNGNSLPKFLPLDSPHARQPNSNPPIFASILRRTTGIKVLECHAFICKREAAANALVRCCFHAYADTMYAKQIGADLSLNSNGSSNQRNSSIDSQQSGSDDVQSQSNSMGHSKRAKSIAALNDPDSANYDTWNTNGCSKSLRSNGNRGDNIREQQESIGSAISRRKSINGSYDNQGHNIDSNNNLRAHRGFSKSMHQLNDMDEARQRDAWMIQQVNQQSFHNPYASRVPSYPAQSVIDNHVSASNGGTLRSIKSMAANSIASTLLKSKKHAKAMSMAQLNREKMANQCQMPLNPPPTMLPPVPAMFLHSIPRMIMNGSQTMRPLGSSGTMLPFVSPPSFDTMTPREVKKMLKKNAKYGLDQQKFAIENGLPPMLPLNAPPIPMHLSPMGQQSKSGTMMTTQSLFTDPYGQPMPPMNDMQASVHFKGRLPFPNQPEQMKPIAIKPSSEFLKSKAGKKWLKQQKQFKKLLPPHLDGLPIVFGPPPVEALDPGALPPGQNLNVPLPPHLVPPNSGLPMMDSSGFYNPHPFGNMNGRASAASTLLRYSPHSQMAMDPNQPDLIDPYAGQHPSMIYGPLHQNHPPSIIYGGPRDHQNGDDLSMTNCDPNTRRLPSHPQVRRNHMIEQSIISLGDENDYEDDEENDVNENNHYHNFQSSASNYDTIQSQPPRKPTTQPPQSQSRTNIHHQQHINDSDGSYQAINHNNDLQPNYNQSNDDQSSYSSGIYKREHLSERAFSYSIRQEQRSNGNQHDYVKVNNHISNNEAQINSRRQLNQLVDFHQHHHNHNHVQHPNSQRDSLSNYDQQHNVQMNELTSRLENQLNMKSFANSKVKSHI